MCSANRRSSSAVEAFTRILSALICACEVGSGGGGQQSAA